MFVSLSERPNLLKKVRVQRIEKNVAFFEDGSSEIVDEILFATGVRLKIGLEFNFFLQNFSRVYLHISFPV